MAHKAETARRWDGERLPKFDRLGSMINSEDTPSDSREQAVRRLAARFGLTDPVARVVAHHAGLGCEVAA